MALPKFLTNSDGTPITRLPFYVDEANSTEMASGNAGRPAVEVGVLHYVSPGIAGQAWKARGGLDAAYGRLEASLVGATGPWTNIGTGSLADPAAEGVAGTLWVRYVSHNWSPSDANPDLYFRLTLSSTQAAAIDED